LTGRPDDDVVWLLSRLHIYKEEEVKNSIA
jgi:hypothetical protein